MFGIIISVIVLITMGYLILKNYKPQVVLAAAGIFLMMCGVWLGFGGVLDPTKSSGYLIVDIYNEILRMLSNRIAGLGLSIMAVGGYARYMERIGASRAMVSLLSRPLKLIRSPYIILSATYVIGQIMAQFITSASGLGMLLMVTLFPTLVSLGVSRLSAVAVIATTMSIEWGILETNSIFAAQVAGMKIATYFFHYQLPVASCVIISVAISHFFVQRAFGKKDKNINHEQAEQKALDNVPPLYYAILPVMPLILMLGSLFLAHVGLMQSELHLVVVMLLSLTVTMFVEFFRKHNLRETMDDVQAFFDGMGTQFANVVTLVVAGEIFAKGLTTIGTVDAVIRGGGAFWSGRYWRDDYYGAGHCHLCHCDGLWQCAVYVICQSYSEYRSRTTCTSGCNDYADAFCHDASARGFADYCGGGRYVRNCRRFAFCGGEADSDPHGSRFRGEYDCHNHAILLSH